MHPDASPGPAAPRVLSVDVLRGLTMFAMVFVNDVAGAKRLPLWLGHYPPQGSGMTFVDVVFPAFLFIVGMSIPLATESRRAKGDGWLRLYGHVVLRTLALLAIGVLMVDGPDERAMGWPAGLWKTLMYLGVIGMLHAIPLKSRGARYASIGVRVGCAGLLAYLAVAFRDRAGGRLDPQWWGILGLIGWAYFWSATAYLLLRRAGQAALVAVVGVMMGVFVADQAGAFDAARGWVIALPGGHSFIPLSFVNIGAHWGSQSAVTMCGVVLGYMLLPAPVAGDAGGTSASHGARVRFAIVFAALLAIAGLVLWNVYSINKNAATPTWCLFSAAITAVLWVALYGVIDVAGWRTWAAPLAWAGAAALLIYILAGLWYAIVQLGGFNWYSQLGARYPEAVLRAWAAAISLTLLGGVLGRVGFKLRL
jgi:heparan-alpha-glucosaminide N-acetyltransferase